MAFKTPAELQYTKSHEWIKIEGDSVFGPGIYDMKGGAYLAYHAFRQICADGARSPLGVTHLYVSDEEIGSPTSRALIEAEGRKAKYVLVTEPARDGGKIVTGRKGVARFEVFIKGVPSHAGSRPPPYGGAAIEPVSRRCRSTLPIPDALTENRAAIGARVPSRASQAATIRWRRSVESAFIPGGLLITTGIAESTGTVKRKPL